jgi:hypothetical protein
MNAEKASPTPEEEAPDCPRQRHPARNAVSGEIDTCARDDHPSSITWRSSQYRPEPGIDGWNAQLVLAPVIGGQRSSAMMAVAPLCLSGNDTESG